MIISMSSYFTLGSSVYYYFILLYLTYPRMFDMTVYNNK